MSQLFSQFRATVEDFVSNVDLLSDDFSAFAHLFVKVKYSKAKGKHN